MCCPATDFRHTISRSRVDPVPILRGCLGRIGVRRNRLSIFAFVGLTAGAGIGRKTMPTRGAAPPGKAKPLAPKATVTPATASRSVQRTAQRPAPKSPMPTPVEFEPISFETFLSKLSAKDRLNVERHATALDEDSDPNRAKVWKSLACTLVALAPQSPKAGGQQNLQYFVPDGPSGKYRMQVFALQDLRDGKILIYTGGEALAAAVASG